MVNFYNTGIDTADLTIFLVIFGLIITSILVLSVYHLQKPRPKIKIIVFSANNYTVDHVGIQVHFRNIGFIIAEDTKYEMKSMTKEVNVSNYNRPSKDLVMNESRAATEDVFIKEGQKCKIKIEITWDNHTSRLKKRNKLTQKFTCDRIENQNVKFEKC